MDSLVGKSILHYQIVRQLGAGGMGVVYEAEDTRLARHVALKFLSKDIEQNSYALQRFQQEARAASALNHPNICTIYAIEECDGQHFIAMELLEGQSLNEKINGHPLLVDRILDIGVQITDGLDVAHSKGIVHRDLKPANIFITTRGQAKILDFGLAKLTYDRHSAMETAAGDAATVAPTHLTVQGTTVGTIAYMSPEQARGEELDQRSDLFSLGAIFYEMATGRIPFEGNTSAVVFQGILDRNPRPPIELNPAVPFKLDEIVSKAMEKDVELRYQSASEIRTDLKRLKRDGAGQSSAGIAAATVAYPAARGSGPAMQSSSSAVILDAARRHKSGTSLVLVVSLAMIVAGLYGFYTWISRWLGDSGPVPFQAMSMEKVTNSGRALLATISPDGKYIVNVADEGHGQQSLWMRHIATGSNTQIMPATEARYMGLSFTPSGDFLYFVRMEPDKPGVGYLYQIPVLGGTPRKLVDDVDSAVSFSPDGQQMVYLRDSSSEANSKLIIAHADGSGERVLAALPLPGYIDPAWSLDGKSIAAAVVDPGNKNPGRIVVINPTSGKEKTVYAGTALLHKPTWMSDGRHLALIFHDISSDWNGQIGVISLTGQKLHRITNDLNVYSNSTLGITRDGQQLVAIQETPQAGVYTMSADTGPASTVTEVDNHGDISVGWLPDGRLLALDYDSHIAMMNADGTNRSVIYQERMPMGDLAVCPDGTHALFFMPNKQTQGINIWRLDLQSGSATVLTNGKVDQNPTCSPDSKYFLYTSLQKGKQVLMEMPLAGGEAKQLSDKFVTFAAISPDGKEIAAATAFGTGVNTKAMIEIIPAHGGLPVKSFAPSRSMYTPALYFSADGRSLYYAVVNKGVSNLVVQPIGVESASLITDFNDLHIYGFDYDWKNKKLAMSRGRSNDDVVLLRQQQEK